MVTTSTTSTKLINKRMPGPCFPLLCEVWYDKWTLHILTLESFH
jgi:hypothetical protein